MLQLRQAPSATAPSGCIGMARARNRLLVANPQSRWSRAFAVNAALGGAQHQAVHQFRPAPVQQLGDRAAHGVPDGDAAVDLELFEQHRRVVGAVLEAEPAAQPSPVAAMVHGNDAEVVGQRPVRRVPVEVRRRRPAVEQQHRGRIIRTSELADVRRSTPGEVHEPPRGQRRSRSTVLPAHVVRLFALAGPLSAPCPGARSAEDGPPALRRYPFDVSARRPDREPFASRHVNRRVYMGQ